METIIIKKMSNGVSLVAFIDDIGKRFIRFVSNVIIKSWGKIKKIAKKTTKLLPVTSNDNGNFTVPNSAGTGTYTVSHKGSGYGDSDYIRLWECNCIAGSYGRMCKHVKSVIAYIDDNNDYDN